MKKLNYGIYIAKMKENDSDKMDSMAVFSVVVLPIAPLYGDLEHSAIWKCHVGAC